MSTPREQLVALGTTLVRLHLERLARGDVIAAAPDQQADTTSVRPQSDRSGSPRKYTADLRLV